MRYKQSLQKFNEDLKSKKLSLNLSYDRLINLLDYHKDDDIVEVGYDDEKPIIKSILPSKQILDEYKKIYEINDFDLRIDRLFKFIDKEGIYFSRKIADSDPSSEEADPDTSKWIYYNSSRIDIPMCCKHYLHYKNIIFKDNQTRETELTHLIKEWGSHVEGSYTVCKNCGEILNPIKDSEFEGFGANNKGIRLREEISDPDDEEYTQIQHLSYSNF